MGEFKGRLVQPPSTSKREIEPKNRMLEKLLAYLSVSTAASLALAACGIAEGSTNSQPQVTEPVPLSSPTPDVLNQLSNIELFNQFVTNQTETGHQFPTPTVFSSSEGTGLKPEQNQSIEQLLNTFVNLAQNQKVLNFSNDGLGVNTNSLGQIMIEDTLVFDFGNKGKAGMFLVSSEKGNKAYYLSNNGETATQLVFSIRYKDGSVKAFFDPKQVEAVLRETDPNLIQSTNWNGIFMRPEVLSDNPADNFFATTTKMQYEGEGTAFLFDVLSLDQQNLAMFDPGTLDMGFFKVEAAYQAEPTEEPTPAPIFGSKVLMSILVPTPIVEEAVPIVEPTPTAEPTPTLSPELTGGIEGIPIPSDLIIQDAFRINNFKKEEIKESYQSVDDLKGHKYLIMFDQNTMRTILIFNENLQKWDIADTGELASIAGVNFSAMLRPSQFNKAEYSSAIKKFNAIGIGTVYWRAFAPNDQIFRPSEEEYNWKYTDDTLKLAKKNNMPITSLQHLVWAKDLRLKEVDHWILSITDPEALKLEITNHIVEIANHIKNDPANYFEENPYVLNVANTGMENNPIFSPNSKNVPIVQGVVVVNEPGYWTRDMQYYNDHAMRVIGPEYIDLAFKKAYESFSTGTMLWLNDFDMLLEDGRLKTNTPRFEKNLETIRRIRAQGIETAGLGFQLHLDATIPISSQMEVEIRRRLQILKDENIPFSVTEMDIIMDGLNLSDDEKQHKQSEIYLWWFNILHEYGCRSFTVFGLNDSNSWYELGGNDKSDPTLLDELFRTKQGYDDLNSWFTRLLLDK